MVDEQHRFGVRQRAALDAKGAGDGTPHVLHMTATPIPRTLALARYSDLDFTVLRELPRGRRPIQTFVCSTAAERARAYERIREELRDGRQAFVVCPLVEESEALQARAATAEFERLRGGELQATSRWCCCMGRCRPAAKQQAMAAFAVGRRRRARRHLGDRGRDRRAQRDRDARRGRRPLRDLAAAPAARPDRPRRARLAVPAVRAQGVGETACSGGPRDGFKLAEIDLELRGEGELVGTRQHGQAAFSIAELPRDAELLERAARGPRIIAEDPDLERPEHALLADALVARLRGRGDGADPRVDDEGCRRRFGGRTLVAPRGRATRPTPERVREALFSILGRRRRRDACLTCSPAPARWRSRRCREGRRTRRWSTPRPAASRRSARNLDALGIDAVVRHQGALRVSPQRTVATLVNTISCSSIPHIDMPRARTGALGGAETGARRRTPASSPRVTDARRWS